MNIYKKIRRIIPFGIVLKKISDNDYPRKIYKSEETNQIIKNLLNSDKPIMISRIGSVELNCISHYWKKRKNRKKKKEYPNHIYKTAKNNAGIFPVNTKILDKFSEKFINCIANTDALGVWNNKFEEYISAHFCSNAILIEHGAMPPFFHINPWSYLLKNKKILFIHPFEKTIKKQYKKRNKLFKNKKILPSFKLSVLKAVQSNADAIPDFKNWFKAYDFMCNKIDKMNFDIAIIGAGSYGLPLASYIKTKGKKAVHLGGSTQLLFGIKGKRWDDKKRKDNALYNEYWTRPLSEEAPTNYKKIEKGCYW